MTHYSNLDYFNEQEFRRKTKTPIFFFLAALLLVFFLTLLISKLDKVAEIKERFLERLR